jgi:hypothetical protein
MNQERAQELAGRLLVADGMTAADGGAFESEMRRIPGTLASLLPEFEDQQSEIVTIVRINESGEVAEGSSRVVLLGLHEDELWQAEVSRADDGSRLITVVTQAAGGWAVFAASDSYGMDGAARVLSRKWSIQAASDDVIAFVTEQRENTGPSSTERFARKLAATHGWSVGDFEFADAR